MLAMFATAVDAASALSNGDLVAHPTTGLWGIAADPRSDRAMADLARLKQVPTRQGFIVCGADAEQFSGWYLNAAAERILATTFEGPVTVVCDAGPRAPDSIVSAQSSVALRVAAHPAPAALAGTLGCPIVSTSLNLPGRPPAADIGSLDPDLAPLLAGGFELGPPPRGTGSTLVDVRGSEPSVLRQGEVTLAAIQAALSR